MTTQVWALGLIALVAIVGLLVVVRRRARAAEAAALKAVGGEIAEPPPELLEKASRLWPRSIESRFLKAYRFPDHDPEIFHLRLSGDRREDSEGAYIQANRSEATVLRSSTFSLPQVRVLPRITGLMAGTGALAKGIASMAESFLTDQIDADEKRVEFPEHARFNESFIVASDDREAARRLLSDELMDALCELSSLQLSADGDTVLFSWMPTGRRSRDLTERLRTELETANRLARLLA
jgi:hypothetical protein